MRACRVTISSEQTNKSACLSVLLTKAWGKDARLEDFLHDCLERGLCSRTTGFDIIMGADVVYEQACVKPLFETVARSSLALKHMIQLTASIHSVFFGG